MVDAPSLATTRTGAPYPDHDNDLPEWTDNYFKVLAEHLEKLGSPKYANAAARDAAIPSPGEGDMCWVMDINVFQVHDGSSWQQVFPPDFPAISSGTAAPSGGSDGDLYFQYV